MNRNSRVRVLACVIGFVLSLLLIGVVLIARQRVLLWTVTTFYTPISGEAEWEGQWELSELGADPSEAGTERVTIPFTGTDFALWVRRGDYRGNFFVSVDGAPANRLPREARGAYLVLTSPDYTPSAGFLSASSPPSGGTEGGAAQEVTIPVASGLDDGPHEAVVVADRGWDQWPLVGWAVSRTPDTTLYRWALVGLVVVGSVCLGGMVWGVRGQRASTDGQRINGWRRREGEGVNGWETDKRIEGTGGGGIWDSQFAVLLVAAGVFYFSPWLPLTLVSGLVLAILVVLRLDLGLALIAVTIPFYRHPRALFGKSFTMAEIVTLLCVGSWAVRWILCRLRSPLSTLHSPFSTLHSPFSILHSLSSLDLAVLFFVLVAAASVFVAEYRHVALRELRVVVLEPALLYLMLRTSRLDGKAIWRVVDMFVVGAVAVALIGLVQYGLGVNVITAEEGFRRLRSVYGSPNNAGLYLGRALPVLVAVALFGTVRDRRVAYGLAAVAVGLAVLLSFSKGALILGVPLALLALGLLAGGRWSWAALGTVVVAAIVAVPLLRTPRFASLFDVRSGTTFFRLQLWRASWMMFRDHPWLGVGLDNFLYQYRGRYILPAAWQEPDLSHPHNVLLDYGCRLGMLGLVAGVWMQVAFWRLALGLRGGAWAGGHGTPHVVGGLEGGHGTPRREGDLEDEGREAWAGGHGTPHYVGGLDRRALALGLMGSMVDFLAHGMVDASYFVIDLAFAFFLTLGVVQWLARSETNGLET